VLERPLWVAHYTQASKPATPGNKPYAIWQRTVGPYNPDGPGGAIKPMLLDQNVSDGPLPMATMSTSIVAPPAALGDPHPDQPALWEQRLDALTNAMHEGLDLTHDTDHSELAPESSRS
jgi:hypothetical protein